jgi:hypothetical protein
VLHFQTVRPSEPVATPTFQKGDGVFLSMGTYQGTIGTFLHFKDDNPNWADILEQDLQVRTHPVELLRCLKGPPSVNP